MNIAADQLSTAAGEHEHFATDHLRTGLRVRAVSGSIVTILSQAGQFILILGSTMVLARLLTPQDFGLVAMVTTIVGFFRIFNEAGLSTATVQREGITHAQVSNLFWANVAVGAVISLFLAISAPIVAWFYREPRLTGVTLALCITFLFTTLTVQHMALLKRQMRFKMIAFIQVGSVAAGIAAGIGLALSKCGYWSLVGMQLVTPLLAFLLTWTISHWRPQLPTRQVGTGSLLRFGANLTASSFLWSIARGCDGLLIGRVYGSASMGLYSRAAALIARPMEQFINPIESVFVPMLSRLQGEPERYRRTVLQTYEAFAITSFFLAGLLLALARPLTMVVLGPRFEQAASIFAGFALLAVYCPLANVASWLLTSQGRGRDFLRLSVIGSCITIISFIAGLPFGPLGVAVAYSTASILILLPIAYYIAGRQGPVRTADLWSHFMKHFPLWIVVFGVTWFARTLFLGQRAFIQVLICAPIGCLFGAAFVYASPSARQVASNIAHSLRQLPMPAMRLSPRK